ncbi:hypothetical protein ACFPOI_57630 [Nonomuraea angiospora]|uniref:Uncharacterized protein n=1 Tax=Nonomuraea angiospora TaxID=46172 RepID=A0ABR9LRD8_9ACTN|nr:hypothetical protein [Nonomuraea angiospora]MBE1583233.1 hypothetical protein [Nonomuraea angiospora]
MSGPKESSCGAMASRTARVSSSVSIQVPTWGCGHGRSPSPVMTSQVRARFSMTVASLPGSYAAPGAGASPYSSRRAR